MEVLFRYLSKIMLPDIKATELGLIALGLLGFIAGLVIHWAIWLMKYSAIVEIGYPLKPKTRKKLLRKYRWHEKLLMTSMIRDAPVKAAGMWFYWAVNVLNVVLFPITLISSLLLILTKGAGWAATLLFEIPIAYLLVSTLVSFIPDLIFLKSERKRYF